MAQLSCLALLPILAAAHTGDLAYEYHLNAAAVRQHIAEGVVEEMEVAEGVWEMLARTARRRRISLHTCSLLGIPMILAWQSSRCAEPKHAC